MGAVMVNNHILSKWHQWIHTYEVQSHTAQREEQKTKKILYGKLMEQIVMDLVVTPFFQAFN